MDPLEELRQIRAREERLRAQEDELAAQKDAALLRGFDERYTVMQMGEALAVRHQTVSERLRRLRRERDTARQQEAMPPA